MPNLPSGSKTPVSSSSCKSASMPNLPSGSTTPVSLSSCKSVFLWEWWLIKVGSKLGVEGFSNRETSRSLEMQLLSSASASSKRHPSFGNRIQVYGSPAIAKRLDYNTLEAVDGTVIMISGCINRSRTLSHGFSHEVCDRFLSGFPCIWEDYSDKSSNEKCGNTTERFIPMSFNDLSVTAVRDLLLSAVGESESCDFTSTIVRDIQKQCCFESSLYQSNKVSTKNEVDHKRDEDVSLSNPTQKIFEESHSVPVELHENEIENYKEAKDDNEEENKKTKLSGKKRGPHTRYPLRSMRMKRDT